MSDSTTATRVSDEEFELDTKNFEDLITKARNLADKMSDLKNSLDGQKNSLMFSWAGDGRDTFEKKYYLLSQQLGDLTTSLYEVVEGLIATEEAYIQADVDLAKTLDGKDSRY